MLVGPARGYHLPPKAGSGCKVTKNTALWGAAHDPFDLFDWPKKHKNDNPVSHRIDVVVNLCRAYRTAGHGMHLFVQVAQYRPHLGHGCLYFDLQHYLADIELLHPADMRLFRTVYPVAEQLPQSMCICHGDSIHLSLIAVFYIEIDYAAGKEIFGAPLSHSRKTPDNHEPSQTEAQDEPAGRPV